MHFEERGAFTGEVAPGMLSRICAFIILGHSERRAIFGESDEMVNRKVGAAITAGLRPILCVGETLAEREEGNATTVISQQLRGGLAGLHNAPGLVVAYEPVWAIGTGQAATPEIAQEIMGGVIRPVLGELLGAEVSHETPLLYGGSVNPGNIASFAEQDSVSGALVGGASLDASQFAEIIRLTASSKGLI